MYHRLQNLGHEVCNCVRWKSQFYESSGIPQFLLQTMTATGARSPSECLGLTDNWLSPRAANQEGLVSKRQF
jgi:hypothetical protein